MADERASILRGLNAANPLAFLTALGVLRVLSGGAPPLRPRLGWAIHAGGWRPVLQLDASCDEEQIAVLVHQACLTLHRPQSFNLGDNLAVDSSAYVAYATTAATAAQGGNGIAAEFAACFASEVIVNKNGKVQDTAFRTMSGAGHQHFLRTMRNLVEATQPEHIQKALFRPWVYDDPVQNMTLRWDPADDSRYALRWSDPSGDADRQRRGSVWGANRLAIEALPLFPVAAASHQLETTGFCTSGSRGTFFTWPVWDAPVALDEVRGLLSLRELQATTPSRENLAARGIVEIFRSQRLTVGKFRNMTWGSPA